MGAGPSTAHYNLTVLERIHSVLPNMRLKLSGRGRPPDEEGVSLDCDRPGPQLMRVSLGCCTQE